MPDHDETTNIEQARMVYDRAAVLWGGYLGDRLMAPITTADVILMLKLLTEARKAAEAATPSAA